MLKSFTLQCLKIFKIARMSLEMRGSKQSLTGIFSLQIDSIAKLKSIPR